MEKIQIKSLFKKWLLQGKNKKTKRDSIIIRRAGFLFLTPQEPFFNKLI